jgi:DNA-binding response OmpR family regulator
LKRHGFETFAFKNGKHALVEFDEKNPSLVIIDWMLPDLVGPEICKLIRSRSSDVPILMLTGRARPDDVAEGLSSGADDYLCKPFSVVELMARIQALLRRSLKDTAAAKGQGKIIVGELILDDDAKSVTHKGKVVDLSPKEFSLLKVLMKNVGKTLSTEVLLNKVWGADFQGDTKTVAVHVRWLRQKLEEDPKNPELLETVHRSGYRLNEKG